MELQENLLSGIEMKATGIRINHETGPWSGNNKRSMINSNKKTALEKAVFYLI
jgi:hypothetical protein